MIRVAGGYPFEIKPSQKASPVIVTDWRLFFDYLLIVEQFTEIVVLSANSLPC